MNATASVRPQESTKIELLRPEEFSSWDELVSRSPHGTIFHNSWWLEATGCDFEILVCRDEEGLLRGGIPLPRKMRAGLRLFRCPALTPYLGPIFDLSGAESVCEKLSLMRSVGESLARAIEGYDSLIYWTGAFGPDLQGFLWAGFDVYLSYTFHLEMNGASADVFKGLTKRHQRNLIKARARQTVIESRNEIDTLIELNRETFARQGLPTPYSESFLRRLWAAAQSRGQVKIYVATDTRGVPAAGLFVVHDTRCAYQIVSGISPDAQTSGGSQLVTWHAIQDSHDAGRTYDFEGSSIRGVEQYYRNWGAVAKPVSRLERAGTVRGSLAQMLWRKTRKG